MFDNVVRPHPSQIQWGHVLPGRPCPHVTFGAVQTEVKNAPVLFA